ncbi:MAG: TIGR01777 family oxidoreductase, partial [Candidatus Poseidoniaceae archaeon]|nr:TIGR01777 family oxidoreductase [Candidatus Poseidoniaceae archaeon]
MVNYLHETRIEAPREVVWEWHTRDGAFDRLAPPWENIETISAPPDLSPGGTRVMKMKMGPIKLKWIAEHTDMIEEELFADRMVRGPFKRWWHTHRFIKEKPNVTVIRDEVSYVIPVGFLGRLFGGRYIRKNIENMFTSRAISLKRDIMRHQSFSDSPRKRILISGASGLIGSQLIPFLDTGGQEVIQLVRRKPSNENQRFWDPSKGELDPTLFEGIDAVIHLGGVGIGDKRWSKKRKQAIVESREKSVSLLSETMASLEKKPEVFVVASAIGIYGNRGDEDIDENSTHGTGFLTDTAKIWESSADAAREAGIRTIHLRTGIVLSPKGGALGRMLFPFKMGAGGPIGSGKQWMSWISMDDHI